MEKQSSATSLVFEIICRVRVDSYIETLPNCDISFKDTLGIREFLENENCQIMVLCTINTKNDIRRVYDIVRQMENYQNKILLFSFQHAQYLEKLVGAAEIFASSSIIDNVLIIDFENEKDSKILKELSEKILSGQKIICIGTKLNLLDYKIIYKQVKEASLMDITESSLYALLAQKVISINGNKFSLNEFLQPNDLKTLSDLLPFHVLEKNFLTRDEIIEIDFRNEDFKKVFFNSLSAKVLKDLKFDALKNVLTNYESTLMPIFGKSFQDIKFFITGIDKNSFLNELAEMHGDQIVLDPTTDQNESSKNFQNFCLENSNKIIFRFHVSNQKNQILTWLDIFNPDLYIKRKFVVAQDLEVDEKELIIAKKIKVFMIANKPGMGKSTTLLNLAMKIQNHWIIWINLVNAYRYLDTSSVDLDSVVTFLLKFSNDSSELTKILLKFSLKNKDSVRVCLFFDGFDEIQKDKYKYQTRVENQIINILTYLKNQTSAKMFILTRSPGSKQLRENLGVTPIRLKAIEEEEQIEFCTKFWMFTTGLTAQLENWKDLNSYVEELFKNLKPSTGAYPFSFLGMPLQIRLCSEIFRFEKAEEIRHLELNLNLYDLYSKFVDKKYEFYFQERICFGRKAHKNVLLLQFKENHRILGMNFLFPRFYKRINPAYFADLNRIGLVQVNAGEINFIHQTFAHYFAAELFVNWMENEPDENLQSMLVDNVLSNRRHFLIRRFINDLLSSKNKSSEILKFYPDIWAKHSADCPIVAGVYNHKYYCKYFNLHKLIQENCSKLIELILENFKRNDILKNEFINAIDEEGDPPLHTAIHYGRLEITSILLNYGPNVTIKDPDGDTCLHLTVIDKDFNDISSRLLQNGADPKIKNESGENPFDLALKFKNWDLLIDTFEFFENDDGFITKLGKAVFRAVEENNALDLALKLMDKGITLLDDKYKSPFSEYGRWNLMLMLMDIKKIDSSQRSDQDLCKELVGMKDNIWDLVLEIKDPNCRNKKKQTFLHFAVAQNQIDVARELIKKGADVNAVDANNKTPIFVAVKYDHWDFILSSLEKINFKILAPNNSNLLHLACKQNKFKEVLEIIKKAPVDLHITDINGKTPLAIAAENEYWELVVEMMKQEILNISNNDKITVLCFVCKYNAIDTAVELIKNGAGVNFFDNNKNNFLLFAANNDRWELVSELIELNIFDVNYSNKYKETLLHVACRKNQGYLALELIKNGADVNFAKENGDIPLLIAAKNGSWNLVSKLIKLNVNISNKVMKSLLLFACHNNKANLALELIKLGADVNVTDKKGSTPLLVAAENGRWDLVSELMNLNVDVNISNKRKKTLLHLACRKNKQNLVLDLVKNGADVNFADAEGNVPLLLAAENKNWDLVSELMKFNASVDVSNNYNQTLLHFACRDNKISLALNLIDSGLDVNFPDWIKRTPLFEAAENKHWDLVLKLIELNGNPNIPDRRNMTILHLACQNNQADVAVMLMKKGCDINVVDKFGRSSLNSGIKNGLADLIAKI